MSDIKVGQLRQVRDTGELILVTELDKIAVLHGDMELVTYLTKGELQTSEISWILFYTDIVDESG